MCNPPVVALSETRVDSWRKSCGGVQVAVGGIDQGTYHAAKIRDSQSHNVSARLVQISGRGAPFGVSLAGQDARRTIARVQREPFSESDSRIEIMPLRACRSFGRAPSCRKTGQCCGDGVSVRCHCRHRASESRVSRLSAGNRPIRVLTPRAAPCTLLQQTQRQAHPSSPGRPVRLAMRPPPRSNRTTGT